jgi:hypothetical protein
LHLPGERGEVSLRLSASSDGGRWSKYFSFLLELNISVGTCVVIAKHWLLFGTTHLHAHAILLSNFLLITDQTQQASAFQAKQHD